MKLLSKFTRVAVEGDTIDGREITRQQIQEMADSYDPKVYGARVWPEHFRGLIPGGPFDALGDVTALKAEEVKEGSDLDGKLGLYAQVEALPTLVTLNAAKQKIFHSIEMLTNFGKSGKAYLVGLAVTDTPASKGTQMMNFGTDGGDVIAGACHEGKLEFNSDAIVSEDTDDSREGTPSFFSKVKGLLGKNKGDTDKRFAEQEKAIEEIAQFAADLEKRLGDSDTVPRETFDALKADHDAVKADLAELRNKLNLTAAPGTTERPPATGGTGDQLADF